MTSSVQADASGPPRSLNPFDGVTQNEPTPFDGLQTQDQVQGDTPNRVVPTNTPALAAIATAPVNSNIDTMRAATANYQQAAQYYGDDSIRLDYARQQKQSRFNDYIKNFGTTDPNGSPINDPEFLNSSLKAAQLTLAEDEHKRAQWNLEQDAVKNIQNAAMHGNSVQAKLLTSNLEHGNPIDVLTDINTKQQILDREIQKAGYDRESQGWVWDAMDAVVGMAIPHVLDPSDIGNVNIDGRLKSWYDRVFSGERLNTEAQSLWSLPLNQFGDAVKQLVVNAQKSSTFLGYHNQTDDLNILASMAKTPSSSEQNAWDTVDNLGFVPFAKVGKMGSLLSLLVRNGDRVGAATRLADAAEVIRTGGSKVAEQETSLTRQMVEGDLLPSAANPDSVGPTISYRSSNTSKLGYMEFKPQHRPSEAEVDLDNLSHFNARGENPLGNTVYEGHSVEVLNSKGFEDQIAYKLNSTYSLSKDDVKLTQVPISSDAAGLAEKAVAMLGENQLTASGRLTQAEQALADQKFKDELSARFDDRVKDVGFSDQTLTTGQKIRSINITVGDHTGIGYSSEEAANMAKQDLAYDDAQVVRDVSGQYFLEITRPVPETGFYTQTLNPKVNHALSRYVLNPGLIGDDMLEGQAQLSGNMRSAFLKNAIRPYVESLNHITAGQRQDLAQVIAAGENSGKWFNADELDIMFKRGFDRLPSENERVAYQRVRDLYDLMWSMRSDTLYTQAATRGEETVSFDTGIGQYNRGNAVVDRDLSTVPNKRAYNVATHEHYNEQNPLTSNTLKTLKDQGYVRITTRNAVDLSDGTTVNEFYMKPGDANIEALRRDSQLGYYEGGHRMYEGKHFVKQAVKDVQADTKKEFLRAPNAYAVMDTRAQATDWASRMESAREWYNENLKDLTTPTSISAYRAAREALDGILEGHAGMPTPDEFLARMASGRYRKDTPFEVTYDRENPEVYNTLNTDVVDYAPRDESGEQAFFRTEGKMYYGSKGEHLTDYYGNLAPTLDPYTTMNKALMNVAQLSSFSDYKTASVERWVNTFKKFTDYDKMPQGSSGWRIFNDANPRPGIPDAIKQKLEAQRQIIRNNIGWKTEWDNQVGQYNRKMVNWIAGTDPTDKTRASAAKMVDWWTSKDPLTVARGWAFDLHLGLFNPGSFPLHASTMFATLATLGGKRAMKAMQSVVPIRMFLRQAGDENLLSHFASNGWGKGLMGFASDEEMKDFMRYTKQGGFLDINGSHALVGTYGPGAVLSDASTLGRIREAGRFFFNEGVLWTRMAAQRGAWDEIRALHPGLDWNTSEFRTLLADRANKYSFSMSDQSRAWWQRGILSVPTQFWGYAARMLEAMFSGEFTRAQRARLILSQLVLGGAAGVPLADSVMNLYKQRTGTISKPDTLPGMMDRGLLDTVLYEMSGADVEAGHRFAAGKDFDNTVESIFGLSPFGPQSIGGMLGGQVGGFSQAAAGGTWNLLKYVYAESGGQLEHPPNADDIRQAATTIGSVSNGMKAYMIMRYGVYLNKSGATVASNMPTASAVATLLLGAPLAEQDYTGTMQAYLKNHKDAVNDLATTITKYRQKMVYDPANQVDYERQINWIVNMTPEGIRAEALRRANKMSKDSNLYDSLNRRLQQVKTQNTAIQQQEDNE